MIAYVTSIGESTTDLCVWSLERLGFETVLLQDSSSLWAKLETIFKTATDDFIRVDADVVVNKNILELIEQKEMWWYQSLCYGWFAQDIIHGGVQFIKKPCIERVNAHIQEAKFKERPETYLTRLQEFHDPRMFGTFEKVCGLHGYRQTDMERVKQTKNTRGVYQSYDWELAEQLETL